MAAYLAKRRGSVRHRVAKSRGLEEMDLGSIAKLIIFVGALIMAIGILFLFFDKIPRLGKLPISRERTSVYIFL